MLFRFPAGFDRHPEQAPGSIDEVQILDGAAELQECPRRRKLLAGAAWSCAAGPSIPLRWRLRARSCSRWTTASPSRPPTAPVGTTSPSTSNNEGFGDDRVPSDRVDGRRRPRPARHSPLCALHGGRYFETPSSFSFEVVPGRSRFRIFQRGTPAPIHVGVDDIGTMGETPDAAPAFPKVERGAILVVRGWAFDLERKMPCKSVFVTVGDECARAIYGIARDDVFKIRRSPSARFTGFTARLGTASLAPGKHRLGLIGVAADESSVAESTYATEIEIEEPVRKR